MAEKKDYYKILGVDKNADEKEIKRMYRKKALQYHPDRNPNKEAEEKFKEISEAYHILSNKELRQRYDMFGTVDDNFGSGGMNAEDIFRDFFKNRGFNPFEGFGFDDEDTSSFNRQMAGQDKVLHVNVTLKEIYNNSNKTIKYSVYRPCDKCNGKGSLNGEVKTCPHCHGTGQMHVRQTHQFGFVEQIVTCSHCHGTGVMVDKPCDKCNGSGIHLAEETLTVKVPTIDKVVQQTYSKRGGGNSCPNNLGPNGDLRFSYKINLTEGFNIEGNNVLNIVTNINVPIINCLIGTKLKIKHLDDKNYEIIIPECTKDGTIITLKGKGFKHSNGYVGDLLVKVNMIMPTKLNEEDKKILNKLQKSKTFK